MNFLIDAQLPAKLCRLLKSFNHNATHTSELPRENRTTDLEICVICDEQERILVTKDDDFVVSRIALSTPSKLLLVSTGNISNNDLYLVFSTFMPGIQNAFEAASFVELTRELLIIHE